MRKAAWGVLKNSGVGQYDDRQVIVGFTKPPYNSVNHLHLHVVVLPFGLAVGGIRKWALTNEWAFVKLEDVLEKFR